LSKRKRGREEERKRGKGGKWKRGRKEEGEFSVPPSSKPPWFAYFITSKSLRCFLVKAFSHSTNSYTKIVLPPWQ